MLKPDRAQARLRRLAADGAPRSYRDLEVADISLGPGLT